MLLIAAANPKVRLLLTVADPLVTRGTTDMSAAIGAREADAISMWEPEAQNALEVLGEDAIVFQPGDLLNVLTEEDRWIAGQQRAPMTREQLATVIDPSVLKEAREEP